MSRQYRTHSKMLHDKFSDKVYQPDLKMVHHLHRLLDMVENERLALAIDHTVAELIHFHNPRHGMFEQEIIEPKGAKQDE